jgi:hypothetical protein
VRLLVWMLQQRKGGQQKWHGTKTPKTINIHNESTCASSTTCLHVAAGTGQDVALTCADVSGHTGVITHEIIPAACIATRQHKLHCGTDITASKGVVHHTRGRRVRVYLQLRQGGFHRLTVSVMSGVL